MKKIPLLLVILSISFQYVFSQEVKQKIDEIDTEISEYYSKISKLQEEKKELQLQYIRERLKKNALPKMEEGEELIEHQAMMLVYSEEHEQAKWVAHIISTEIINGSVTRTNDFRTDSKVKTGSAEQEDYFFRYEQQGEVAYDGLGYDRGHLAPSADFRWSQTALSESYFYSNMSPQLGVFNREGWAHLEGAMRAYVVKNNTDLYIITAPVLTDNLEVIERGVNQVSIPEYFYKIAYDMENQVAIAFLIPHKEFEHKIDYYAVSIDSIEAITGIDFFCDLPDEIENKIEKQNNVLPFITTGKNIDITPITDLKKGQINTTQVKEHIGSNKKVTVCGTIIATKKHKKGHVFIDMDKSFPNQPLAVTIWGSNVTNFSYEPEVGLLNKKVCLTGKISEYKGTPTMYLNHGKDVEFIED